MGPQRIGWWKGTRTRRSASCLGTSPGRHAIWGIAARSKVAAIAGLLVLCAAAGGAASASAAGPAPTNLLITSGVESLQLGWGVTSTEGLAGFRVRWRAIEPLALRWNPPIKLPPGARGYTITGLNSQLYEIRLRALLADDLLGGLLRGFGTPLLLEETLGEELPGEEPPPSSTRFVSTAGSDLNDGSQAAPWRTIAHAASADPGSTVLIEGGTYAEDVKLAVSGAAGSPTSFEAYRGEAVTVRSFNVAASHVAIENLTISGSSGSCVSIQPGLSDVVIDGNRITGCGSDGIHFVRPGNPPSSNYTTSSRVVGNTISGVGVSNSAANDMTIYANYLTVLGNDMTGSRNDAIDLWGDHLAFRRNNIHDISNSVGHHDDALQTWTGLWDGAEGNPVTNLLFEQNRIANVLGGNAHGFMVEGPGHHDWTVRDNVFQNIGSIGMILGITGSGSAQNLSVYNNTFFNAGPNDVVEFNALDTGVFVNNIVQGGGEVWVASGAVVREDYNLFSGTWINVGGGPHDLRASPGFVNASAGDFQLTADSPAVDSGDNGTVVSPVRPYDFAGDPVVGIVDRGAFEHQ